jgi:transcriptional regulator with XRE-family HTH domain
VPPVANRSDRVTAGPKDGRVVEHGLMNALRRLRLAMGLSQSEFATLLGVPEQTYRTWDSNRRRPPRTIVYRARRLKETDGGKLLPLQVLGAEYHVHVRTLRKAAQDGRL